MRPIDFVLFDGDSNPNQPIYQITEAMYEPVAIFSADKEFIVCGYYWEKGQMIIEIKEKANV